MLFHVWQSITAKIKKSSNTETPKATLIRHEIYTQLFNREVTGEPDNAHV